MFRVVDYSELPVLTEREKRDDGWKDVSVIVKRGGDGFQKEDRLKLFWWFDDDDLSTVRGSSTSVPGGIRIWFWKIHSRSGIKMQHLFLDSEIPNSFLKRAVDINSIPLAGTLYRKTNDTTCVSAGKGVLDAMRYAESSSVFSVTNPKYFSDRQPPRIPWVNWHVPADSDTDVIWKWGTPPQTIIILELLYVFQQTSTQIWYWNEGYCIKNQKDPRRWQAFSCQFRHRNAWNRNSGHTLNNNTTKMTPTSSFCLFVCFVCFTILGEYIGRFNYLTGIMKRSSRSSPGGAKKKKSSTGTASTSCTKKAAIASLVSDKSNGTWSNGNDNRSNDNDNEITGTGNSTGNSKRCLDARETSRSLCIA